MLKLLKTILNSRLYYTVTVFGYVMIVGLLIQKVVLPYVFPSLHAGHGLIQGFDPITFHECALELNVRMNDQGLQAWTLRPWYGNFQPAAIAALFYYFTGISEPWIMLPFNAVVHALSAFLLVTIFMSFVSKQSAIIASIPFVIFPANLQWIAQIHRDGPAFLGIFSLLLGALILLRGVSLKKSYDDLVAYALLTVFGIGCLYISREYMTVIMLSLLPGVFLLLFTNYFLFWVGGHSLPWKKLFIETTVICLMGALMWVANQSDLYLESLPQVKAKTELTPNPNHKHDSDTLSEKVASGITAVNPLPASPVERVRKVPNVDWYYTPFLPRALDSKLYSLAQRRNVFIDAYGFGGSFLDREVRFEGLGDMVRYVPRALWIGLAAPFPDMWFEEGSRPSGTLERRIVSVEMIISYFCLLGIPVLGFYCWNRPSFWLCAGLGVALILIFSLTVPSVGNLHRMRFGFYTLLVGLGICGWCILWEKWRNKKHVD